MHSEDRGWIGSKAGESYNEKHCQMFSQKRLGTRHSVTSEERSSCHRLTRCSLATISVTTFVTTPLTISRWHATNASPSTSLFSNKLRTDPIASRMFLTVGPADQTPSQQADSRPGRRSRALMDATRRSHEGPTRRSGRPDSRQRGRPAERLEMRAEGEGAGAVLTLRKRRYQCGIGLVYSGVIRTASR